MRSKKRFGIIVALIIMFCILYEGSHSYSITGYGREENMWTAKEGDTGYILNDFSAGLTRGEYSLSFEYKNDTNSDVTIKILDMEHNDGNNRLGVAVAEEKLEHGLHDKTIEFELTRDSQSLQLYADKAFAMYDWKLELVSDYYTDGIFLCLFLIVLAYLLYFKLNWKKPQYTAIVGAAGIFITLPLVGEMLQGGHDLGFHISRIQGIAGALSSGQFPVRINTDINYGYGFVSEILYPDLFVYIPALLMMLGMSLMAAYKYWILLINIATALIGYYSFSRLLKSEKLGTVCAFLYLVNPYRLNNIFLRASIGEVLAQTFLPLLIYALVEVLYRDYKKWWLLVIAATGIMQSHVLSLEISVFMVVIFFVISLKSIFSGEAAKRITGCLKAACCVILINLWFLVPFLDHIKYEYYLVAEKGYLSATAVYLYQMFLSDFKVTGANVVKGVTGEMPLTIGIFLLLGSVSFVYYAYGLKQIEGSRKKIGSISLMFGILSCYMASEYFPWKLLEKYCEGVYELLAKMQYSWRMLGYASLFLGIVTAIAVSALWKDRKKILVYGILVGSAMLMLRGMDGYYVDRTDPHVLVGRNQDFGEVIYLDYYYDATISESDFWVFRVIGEQIVAEPELDITGFEKRGTDIQFHFERANADEPVAVRMPLYNYSLHKVYLNGKELDIFTGGPGMITVEVPEGVSGGDMEAVYVGRNLYRIADLCSFITILGIVVYVFWKRSSQGRLAFIRKKG